MKTHLQQRRNGWVAFAVAVLMALLVAVTLLFATGISQFVYIDF